MLQAHKTVNKGTQICSLQEEIPTAVTMDYAEASSEAISGRHLVIFQWRGIRKNVEVHIFLTAIFACSFVIDFFFRRGSSIFLSLFTVREVRMLNND